MTSPIALPAAGPVAYAPLPREVAAPDAPDAETETPVAAFHKVLAAAAGEDEADGSVTSAGAAEETPELEETPQEKKEAPAIVVAPWTPPAIVRDPRMLFGWQTVARTGELHAATPEAVVADRIAASLAEVQLTGQEQAAVAEAVEAAEGEAAAPSETAFALRATPGETPRPAESVRPSQRALPDKAAAPNPAAQKPEPAHRDDHSDNGSEHQDSHSQNRQPARQTTQAARPATTPAPEEATPAHPVHTDAAATTAPVAAARTFGAEMDAQARPVEAPAPAAPATRIAEPDEAAPAPKTVQEISLRVAGDDNQRVELRVMERAGEIRLTVRSADEGLAREMRGNLSELSSKLGESGYRAETWQPARADSAAFSDRQDPSQQNDSGRQQRHQRQPGQPQQQQQHQDERRQRPAWLEEFEQWR